MLRSYLCSLYEVHCCWGLRMWLSDGGPTSLACARPWTIPSTLRGKEGNWKHWWESLMTWCQVLSFLLEDVRTGSLGLRDSRRAERLLSKHDIWVYISGTYAILGLTRQGQVDRWALWPTNWKISSVSELQVQWEILSPKIRWRMTEEDTHIELFPPHTAVCVLPDNAYYICTRKIQAHFFQLFFSSHICDNRIKQSCPSSSLFCLEFRSLLCP